MSLKREIQQLLAKYNISPNKVLGQNFLIDEKVINSLLDTAKISKKDTVVEVGSGTGVITKKLARVAKRVLAVEKDPKLVELLKQEFSVYKNVEVINEDILKWEFPQNHNDNNKDGETGQISNVKGQLSGLKLVGAIPYYLTARLFRHFLQEMQNSPLLIAVIIPKAVAQRICAKPPNLNLLAVSVQIYGEPKIIKNVPRTCFWPQPKVDSAILIVSDIAKPKVDEEHFFEVLKAGFSSPRKKLITNLSKKLKQPRAQLENIFKKTNIDPSIRAESLTVEKWKELVVRIEHLTHSQ